MTRPGLLPRFERHRYPDTRSRYQMAWVTNACTRSVNVECGKTQFALVWTRKAYRR